ncbi:MAG TPA: hypothetical protein VF881_02905 [Polyangiaceae bacterium]
MSRRAALRSAKAFGSAGGGCPFGGHLRAFAPPSGFDERLSGHLAGVGNDARFKTFYDHAVERLITGLGR